MILWVFRGQERQSHSSFVQEAATVDFQEVPDVTVEKRNIEHNWCSDFLFIYFLFFGGGMGQEDGSTALKSALQYNWLGLKE